jgi:hypothetical protein
MKIQSPISTIRFDQLKPGDFFLHFMVEEETGFGMKVTDQDGSDAVLDFNYNANGSRAVCLVEKNAFINSSVALVSDAMLRPKVDKAAIVLIRDFSNMTAPVGALILTKERVLIRVKYQNREMCVDVKGGNITNKYDTTKAVWTPSWQIVIPRQDGTTIIFEHS